VCDHSQKIIKQKNPEINYHRKYSMRLNKKLNILLQNYFLQVTRKWLQIMTVMVVNYRIVKLNFIRSV